jgi:hypothetical protein
MDEQGRRAERTANKEGTSICGTFECVDCKIYTSFFLLVIIIFVPTGATGVTGVTGPTGPTVTANNLNAASGAAVSVPHNSPLPVTTQVSNGTAITNNNGIFTLAANQTYFVDYQADATVPPMSTAAVILQLNGAPIPGSGGQLFNNSTAAVATGSVAGSTIVQTGTLPGTLSLVNNTGTSVQFGGTSVSIVKIG